jgi:hypothetical protein
MIERLANVIYWAAIVFSVVLLLTFNGSAIGLGIRLALVVLAIGWALRYILIGKKTLKP